MPKDIEDEFKLDNWLSILTYDVAKYAAAGGAVAIEVTPDGIVIHLSGVTMERAHGRFRQLVALAQPEPAEAHDG